MRKTTLAAVCIAVLTLAGAVAAVAVSMRSQVVTSYVQNSLEIEQPYGGSVPWSKLERHPEARELYRSNCRRASISSGRVWAGSWLGCTGTLRLLGHRGGLTA
jgi:hypothetical protein